MKRIFEESFRKWTEIACNEWVYDNVSEEYYERVFNRLPPGLRSLLGYGIDSGLIVQKGKEFTLKGLEENKGPYNWLSRDSSKKVPATNWEYCVQVAEYVRLFDHAERNNLNLTFEDDLMDLSLKQDDKLLVCCEVKEKSKQAQALIRGIKKFEDAPHLEKDDRGKDPLRKAKYIVDLRPLYFYVVSIGRRFEYLVSYPENKLFQLNEDLIPFR